MPTDIRHQVFISSTFKDLKEERQAVMQALLELGCIPAGMELFPATNEDSWWIIEREISQSDYYVLIIGGRYGSTTTDGISFTEREYEYAKNKNIPILAFLHGDPESIPAGRSEMTQEAQDRLKRFRERVCQAHLVKSWLDSKELGSVVTRAVVRAKSDHSRPGWIRGDMAATPEMLQELAELKSANRELQLLHNRSSDTPPPGTENLQQGDDTICVGFKFIDSKHSTYIDEIEITWNTIVIVVGPHLLRESHERAMKSVLAEYVKSEAQATHQNLVLSVDIKDEMFQTIKVQLVALGILVQGVRRRAVSDTDSYWMLTEYGQALMYRLTALRRPNAAESV